jgi:hypothetical protein
MARKFLWFVFGVILLVILGAFALRIWSDELTELAFVPQAKFVEQTALETNAYEDPSMWFARPGIAAPQNPVRWQPGFAAPEESTEEGALTATAPVAPIAGAATGDSPFDAAVFFVHPTSYLDTVYDDVQWNASLENEIANTRAKLFLRGMASPFNRASEIWAPRYRQASFGAFVSDAPEADRALDAAYRDVEQAFDYFIESIGPDKPIILAGHSQGAAHIVRLLAEKIAGTPLQPRIAMAYPIGWPISIEHDLPALGLPACATPQQGGCIIAWSSFAEPAEPEMILRRYRGSPGLDGQPRGERPILCVNPLTGTMNSAADAGANLGTLVPNDDLSSGELVAGAVPARCDGRGLLLIGDPPELGPGVLPGNNYHVYDIPLFWKNLQADVERRMSAWAAARS